MSYIEEPQFQRCETCTYNPSNEGNSFESCPLWKFLDEKYPDDPELECVRDWKIKVYGMFPITTQYTGCTLWRWRWCLMPDHIDHPDCIHYNVCWSRSEYGNCEGEFKAPCKDYLSKNDVVILKGDGDYAWTVRRTRRILYPVWVYDYYKGAGVPGPCTVLLPNGVVPHL